MTTIAQFHGALAAFLLVPTYMTLKLHSCLCLGRPHGRLRCVLLILLILSKHGAWVLEQPEGSLLTEHPRWQWLCNRIAKETYLHAGL